MTNNIKLHTESDFKYMRKAGSLAADCLDYITEYGCWEDDNDDFVKKETVLPTEIDRERPRVEIIIKEI